MNYLTETPDKQEGKCLTCSNIASFALSLQGTSHIDNNTPCQDYNNMHSLDKEEIIIAAVADGVGSCKLSHWGAYTAVNSALDYLEEKIKNVANGGKLVLDSSQNDTMKQLLVESFRTAQRAVEQMADEANITVYNFQSTLTVAVYDGSNLLFGHVGDDGIVAQTQDGNVEMVTARLKGEEASSVYPLQSGEQYWTFGRSSKPVVAFMMATDGVLDAFVSKHVDAFGVNYFNGICYSFMEDAVYKLAENTKTAADEALNKYKEYMLSPEYRNVVTDDLTLVTVVNPKLVNESVHPQFSKEVWDTIEKESIKQKQSRLWGKSKEGNGVSASLSVLNKESLSDGSEMPVIMKDKKAKGNQVSYVLAAAALVVGLGIGAIIGKTVLAPVKEADFKDVKSKCESLEKKIADKDKEIAELKKKLSIREGFLKKQKSPKSSEIKEKNSVEAKTEASDSETSEKPVLQNGNDKPATSKAGGSII